MHHAKPVEGIPAECLYATKSHVTNESEHFACWYLNIIFYETPETTFYSQTKAC